MSEAPAWVDLLFKRGHGLGCFATYNARFHQRLIREYVQSLITANEFSATDLREASIKHLQSDDMKVVYSALAFLMVVGESSDVPAVEPLTTHPLEGIRKAASTCCFELKYKRA